MGINLEVPGDPGSIRSLADWLKPKASDAVNDLHKRLKKTSEKSALFWEGQTGEGFRDTVDAIAEAVDPVDIYAMDAAEVFHAYAGWLERGKDKFSNFAEDAFAAKLMVVGSEILPPMAPKPGIAPTGKASPIPQRGPNGESFQALTPDEYAHAVKLYNQIAGDVGTWWAELENWIDEYIVPLMSRVTEFDALAKAYDTLQVGNDFARTFLLNLHAGKWKEQLALFEEKAKQAKADADSHNKKMRSGDPRIKKAAEKVRKPDLDAESKALAEKIKQLKKGTRIIARGGLVIDIVVTAADISSGGSPSSAGAGIVGGAAGATAGGGLAVAISAGTFGTAGLVAVGAWAMAEGAKWAWESSVPLDVRETIDAAVRDWFIDVARSIPG